MNGVESAVRRQDFIRDEAGASWTDGLLLGNGDLGVLAFGSYAFEWLVNKVDVYPGATGKPVYLTHREVMEKITSMEVKSSKFLDQCETDDHKAVSITPVHLRLKIFEGFGWNMPAVPKMSQHLSLYDAELVSGMTKASLQAEAFSFIPRGRSVLCIRACDENRQYGADRTFVWEILRPVNEKFEAPLWTVSGGEISFLQKLPGEDVFYAVSLKLVPHNGQEPVVRREGNSFHTVRTVGAVDAFLAVRSSRTCADPLAEARRAAEEAAASGFDVLRMENRSWWKEYYSKAWAEFASEPEIGKYWTFSLYELACSYGKAPMPGLNGLACGPVDVITTGASSPYYTHDQNVQISVMPSIPLNHCEFVSVMADTYLNAAEILKAHTKELFGCGGICLPLCMFQDGREVPVASYRYTLCGSAYSGMIFVLAWRYSRDEKLLREKLYPLLREFVRFYLGIMHRGADGMYHLDWSVPPEIFTMTRDDTCTISLLKPCLETVVEAASLFGTDREECECWKDVLAHTPAPALRPEGGWWCGPDIPLDHYMYGGHLLYPVFPSEICLDPGTAEKTLDYIRKSAVERSCTGFPGEFHYIHGWCAFNVTAVTLRTGDPREGWNGVRRFLDHFGKPNGLFSHNSVVVTDSVPGPDSGQDVTPNPAAKRIVPSVMEGSSAFLFLAAETLLQSWGGTIRLFPCVPGDFTGSFHGLLAQGGFEVSAEMEKGRITGCSVRSLRGGTFRMLDPADRTGSVIEKTLAPGEDWNFSIERQ
ncbi:MAG: hypothetical protein BWY31_04238 [Lentisphaerae bacterium ADurb.Bin242]|nr:MAG: hypothetical protein BWY31_04238 [Lentisphaerae bacterium ADurb.Bin242]